MDKAMARKRALELFDSEAMVVVSSLGEAGFPESRIMFNLRSMSASGEGRLAPPFTELGDGFHSFIGTNTSSRKTAQFRADDRTCLYISRNADFRGLEVIGRMAEVGEAAIKQALWREGWERYYPGGPTDPDYAVFRFRPEVARYYESLSVTEFRGEELEHA